MARSFREILSSGGSLAELAAAADALSPEERVALVRSLSAKELAALWAIADREGPSVSLSFLLPEKTPEGHTVEWQGKNSLPLFHYFSKRFTRSAQAHALIGQNHTSTQWLIGPGYFTTTVRAERPGQLLLDYTRTPPRAPKGWPRVRSNARGASRLVFKDMQDYLRPVGQGLAIGAAFTADGRPKGAYFALARGETLPIGD